MSHPRASLDLNGVYQIDANLIRILYFHFYSSSLKCGFQCSQKRSMLTIKHKRLFMKINFNINYLTSLTLCWSNLNPYCMGRKAVFFFSGHLNLHTCQYVWVHLARQATFKSSTFWRVRAGKGLNSWSRVVLKKQRVPYHVKELLVFYRTHRFSNVFTTAHHLSLSWTRSV
jgi:hypothetical protein